MFWWLRNMYLAVEKYNRLKVFTLHNILCFHGNILKLKGIRFMGITFATFFPFRAIFIDLNKKQKRGEDLLLWMNVMLDFICMGFVELWETPRKRKIHNQNVRLQRESNQQPIAFETGALDRPVTLTDDKLCSKVLHYYGIWIKSTLANTFIKCIMVSCIHTEFCKQ